MVNIIDKHAIIKLNELGKSTREISRELKIHRTTVTRYLKRHFKLQEKLKTATDRIEILDIQERIVEPPKYNLGRRKSIKYNSDMDAEIDRILEFEDDKTKLLGSSHKQKLTVFQIHEIMVSKGFDIGKTTIGIKVNEKRNKKKEAFIRQHYEHGDRLEYDFGEVKLMINGILEKFYLAVFSAPASKYRFAYLYTNQSQDSFLDSHVKFFEMIGGIYKEVVYDNMRNVVSKFIGKNEKILNEVLLKMSIYYGFNINVTNCFSGNEKGFVEGSVKLIRNKAFSKSYSFNSIEEAQIHLEKTLEKINENSEIDAEKTKLKPYKPKLEIGTLVEHYVDKYSFVRIENNFYSVPEYLVGKKVNVKKYIQNIIIYSNNNLVCEYKKINGYNKYAVDILHYLNTLKKKPGAIPNSKALDLNKNLKYIYQKYYTAKPKQFIDILQKYKEKDINEIENILVEIANSPSNMNNIELSELEDSITKATKRQINLITQKLMLGAKYDA